MQTLIHDATSWAQSQRRAHPTISDFHDAIKATGYTLNDLEDEALRYRQSLNNVTTGSKKRRRTHVYRLPSPSPLPSLEPPLQDLLGPELLEPRKRIELPPNPKPGWMAHVQKDHPGLPSLLSTKPTNLFL